MAATLIADVIEPSIFTAYFLQRMLDRWAFHQAGVVSTDPRIDGSIGNGGRTINMPYWGDLTGAGASEVLSDTTPLTPQKIAALQDVAALNFRGKAFAANELAQAVAGSEPMAAIASQVADYWIMDMGTTVNAILTGIF
ncbi:MAG: coat protein, partial [Gammaproteobacteria bacterium]